MPQYNQRNREESYDRDHFLEAFSNRLQQAIQEAGYRLSDHGKLAQQFGVSRQAVRKWLEGKTLPSATRLPEIADRLGVRHGWLATGEPPMRKLQASTEDQPIPADYNTHGLHNTPFSITQEEAALLQHYRKLSNDAQYLFRQLFKALEK